MARRGWVGSTEGAGCTPLVSGSADLSITPIVKTTKNEINDAVSQKARTAGRTRFALLSVVLSTPMDRAIL